MNKKLMLIVFLLITLTSCKKEKEMRSVSGYIYKNCEKDPIVGLRLSVVGMKNRAFQSTEEIYLGEITTNNEGFYSLAYETDQDFDWIQLVKDDHIPFIHVSEKLNQVQYESATVNHNVILKVIDSLSQNDTLYFGATMNGTQFSLPGPFKDGQIIPIEIRPNIGVYAGSEFIPADRVGKGLFWWGLGWEEFQKVSYDPNFQVPPNMIRGPLQPICGQGDDFIVDLRGKTGSE